MQVHAGWIDYGSEGKGRDGRFWSRHLHSERECYMKQKCTARTWYTQPAKLVGYLRRWEGGTRNKVAKTQNDFVHKGVPSAYTTRDRTEGREEKSPKIIAMMSRHSANISSRIYIHLKSENNPMFKAAVPPPLPQCPWSRSSRPAHVGSYRYSIKMTLSLS